MKKKFICLLTVFCFVFLTIISSNSINASEPNKVEFTEDSIEILEYEMGEDSPYSGQYLTYTVDENNNVVRIERKVQSRSVLVIAVFVKGVVVGYLTATVIDGIVIAVTGQSGAWWCAQAITNVLKRPYNGKTYINCNVYPPHSYEGAMCNKY